MIKKHLLLMFFCGLYLVAGLAVMDLSLQSLDLHLCVLQLSDTLSRTVIELKSLCLLLHQSLKKPEKKPEEP